MKKLMIIFSLLVISGCTNKLSETIEPTSPTETELAQKAIYQDVTMIEQGEDIIIPFNTTISLETLNQQDSDLLFDAFNESMHHYAKLFDAHHFYTDEHGNELINVAYLNEKLPMDIPIEIDKDLFNLIQLSIDLTKLSNDKFNFTLYDLSQLWDPLFSPFPMNQKDPDSQLIQQALACKVSANDLDKAFTLNASNNTFTKHATSCETGTKMDLGGIAKGYALDLVSQRLSGYGVPFLINAGTSSISIYTPENIDKTWYIGIRDPFARVSLLYDVGIDNSASFTTSGDDSQYFLLSSGNENIIRHHILDATTGYSNNFIRSATVYSSFNSNAIGDALSTALFNCENDVQRNEVVNAFKNQYKLEIEYAVLENTNNEGGNLAISAGFNDILLPETISEHVFEIKVSQ